ncbi:hypothetical protein [Flavobacterium phragmitis]|uniref:Uncharacterized protein n=1 Tax=Flavobacterium phragmitis TaxID=739143 RepID=A0A1I1X381_9FLAO|nr:hypothetical protein [Flavobacterium phragmitis]SFE01809.1 hypothetical protein SAMN05216297_11836 [Flavobacterium phragmitis]
MLKNKRNIFKLAIFIGLLIVMLIWANYLSRSKAFYKNALENRKEESYSGIVIEKYIDSSQHCTPMLKITQNSSISLENSFWNEVEIGDSIVKTKGQTYINLYRNNKLKQIFDYNIYFRDLIEQKSEK